MKTPPPGMRTVLLTIVLGLMLLAQMWRALRWQARPSATARPAAVSPLPRSFPTSHTPSHQP